MKKRWCTNFSVFLMLITLFFSSSLVHATTEIKTQTKYSSYGNLEIISDGKAQLHYDFIIKGKKAEDFLNDINEKPISNGLLTTIKEIHEKILSLCCSDEDDLYREIYLARFEVIKMLSNKCLKRYDPELPKFLKLDIQFAK